MRETCTGNTGPTVRPEGMAVHLHRGDISAAQQADPALAKVRDWILEDHKPTTPELEVESAEVKMLFV